MQLVFDLGGTNMRLALAENGTLNEILRIPTDRSATGFARFLGVMQEVAGKHKISSVAGGAPLQLRGKDGEVMVATNLTAWLGLNFRKGIEELFNCPVLIANDVELCGLGEAHFGGGMKKGVMAYYTMSTGVNAARIVDGTVDLTMGRYEMGYQVIDHENGKAMSLETLIGGASLERRLGKPPHEVRDKAVWAGVERYLAAGLYNTMLYWSPQRVVLGGKMMLDINLDRVADNLRAMPKVHDEWPELALAECGDEGGVRGAVMWLAQNGYK
jgi:predicted NBD/HSP70 family sugar kinase